MAPFLLLAFIGVPIIEIAVLIQVGGLIGMWPTLGLVVLSAIIGSLELRRQGLATVTRLQTQVQRGELPTQTLFDGVCLVAAGALLLTPGFVTDAIGLSLFLPPVRRFLRATVGAYAARRMTMHVHASAPGGSAEWGTGRSPGDPIDVTYTDVTEDGHEDETDPGKRVDPPNER